MLRVIQSFLIGIEKLIQCSWGLMVVCRRCRIEVVVNKCMQRLCKVNKRFKKEKRGSAPSKFVKKLFRLLRKYFGPTCFKNRPTLLHTSIIQTSKVCPNVNWVEKRYVTHFRIKTKKSIPIQIPKVTPKTNLHWMQQTNE